MSRPQAEPRPPEGLVVVWQQDDGYWRWRWRPGDDDTAAIVSHRAFDSAGQARESAEEAFPGCPQVGPDEPEPPLAVPRRRARLVLLAAAGVVALVAVRRHRHPERVPNGAARGRRRNRSRSWV